ncbi:hypothetical protein H920_13123 [Fukomys damarensis]|uniref:Uncharacterized protein n=1 Tax=Fukomys damarensis TaxID=885580 RepID=A0A091D5S9_FUKDA|nr:hypothetical protein H920_13123 [Fukomys damarensis]
MVLRPLTVHLGLTPETWGENTMLKVSPSTVQQAPEGTQGVCKLIIRFHSRNEVTVVIIPCDSLSWKQAQHTSTGALVRISVHLEFIKVAAGGCDSGSGVWGGGLQGLSEEADI